MSTRPSPLPSPDAVVSIIAEWDRIVSPHKRLAEEHGAEFFAIAGGLLATVLTREAIADHPDIENALGCVRGALSMSYLMGRLDERRAQTEAFVASVENGERSR
jgi:hypothetical protein